LNDAPQSGAAARRRCFQKAMASTYEDLQQITHRFFYFLDERRYEDLLALMREDAVWHRQGKVLKGRAAILAALEERSRTQRIRHVITNVFLDKEDEKTASLIAYMTAYRFDNGSVTTGSVTIDGPFRFLLVRTQFVREAGKWRIAEQAATPEFEFRSA
jgi:SnoaL-like domain